MKVLFSGGLGNQMFQYAFLLALRNLGYKVSGDISLFLRNNGHYGFELPRVFGLSESFTKTYLYAYGIPLLCRWKKNPWIFREYDQIIDIHNIPTHTHFLLGYWQKENYFSHISNIIRTSFTFCSIDNKNRNLSQKMKETNSVSIHLRRGDYLNSPLYQNICTEAYYREAIQYFSGKSVRFFIFSDDIVYAKNFIKKLGQTAEFITHNQGMDSYKDMFLMASCKNNIIANSSFSWWGAWLNPNKNKQVITPNIWINKPESTYEGIFPPNWIRI